MKAGTVVRLALAGSRTDTVRVVLTALSAALAALFMLAAATVLSIPGTGSLRHTGPEEWATRYRLTLLVEPGLRPGVALALVLLTIPVLGLAAQCGRLGAVARDRRLAGYRLAGATPRQAITIAAAETGVAAAVGSVLGLGGYLVGRVLLGHPDAGGKLLLPTDVLPPWWAIAALCAGLPVIAALVAAVLLRRVTVTPLGVVRPVRARAPRPWAAVLVVVAVALLAVLQPAAQWADRHHWNVPGSAFTVVLFVAALAAAVGVVLGTGSISYAAGRVLHRFARRPATLLAARRLVADPWSGSRTFAVLMICVLFGAGAAAVRAWFATDFATQDESLRWEARMAGQPFHADDHSFYFQSLDLVNAAVGLAIALAAAGMLVAIAESIVSRRRVYASLVATGVPRGTLARATLWQTFAPLVPAVLAALVVGVSMPRALASTSRAGGGQMMPCTDNCQPGTPTIDVPLLVHRIPVPFGNLALVGAGALAAALVMVGIGLLFLRGATAVEELRTT